MKAIAKYWVNYNGAWHPQGDIFEIDAADAEEMKQHVELVEEEPHETDEAPVKRGRKRKTEAE